MEYVEELSDSSHQGRFVQKCRLCGQLYLVDYEEFETWSGSPFDGDYRTFVPVETLDRARELAASPDRGLLSCKPALLVDRVDGRPGVARWNVATVPGRFPGETPTP